MTSKTTPLAIICFVAAALIEILSTIISVNGMAAYFGFNVIIMALAAVIDIGAIACWVATYNMWSKMKFLMRSVGLALCAGTMIFSASGVGSYLMADFQKASVTLKESGLRIEQLVTEQKRLLARKSQIETEVSDLRTDMVTAKIRMSSTYAAEKQNIDNRLVTVEQELNTLQQAQIAKTAKAGTIIMVADMFNVPEIVATKWVIAFVVSIFTPLAFFLIILGNFIRNTNSPKVEEVVEEVAETVTEEVEAPVEEVMPELTIKRLPTFEEVVEAPKPAKKRGRRSNAEKAAEALRAQLEAQQAGNIPQNVGGTTDSLRVQYAAN